eukprot:TRINITY_DN3591_c0_g1_i1.p1 TRINITY_DN3591_c0_g1~~TRINITY_DN3591_c0_g1_i1.p1  ORF type:complete len:1479 (-),score=439.91 TRINITY_DN3591_c0_g1_i1:263-4699(-)
MVAETANGDVALLNKSASAPVFNDPSSQQPSLTLPPLAEGESPAKVKKTKMLDTPQWNSFMDRQQSNKLQSKLKMVQLQRELVKHEYEQTKIMEGVGAAGFILMLRRRFGTVTAAWRQALDKDCTGRLCFNKFCQVCRDIGYTGNLKDLWKELDRDASGFISLDEIAPEAAQALEEFRALCCIKHGSTLQAWHWLDNDKNHRLDLGEFTSRVKAMGYTQDPKKLFHYLRSDLSRFYLTLGDLDQDALHASHRGDEKMIMYKEKFTKPQFEISTVNPDGSPKAGRTPGGSRVFGGSSPMAASRSLPELSPSSAMAQDLAGLDDDGFGEDSVDESQLSPTSRQARRSSTLNSRWIKEMSAMQIQSMRADKQAHFAKDKSMKNFEGLRRLLRKKFNSMYAAWRQALDLDGNGRLSFGEFCVALRELGYNGSVKSLFKELEKPGTGFIYLEQFCPQTAAELQAYNTLVTRKYGNKLTAWFEGMKASAKKGEAPAQVDEAQFIAHCQDLGYPYDPKSLFQQLVEEKGRHFLTLKDYDIRAFKAYIRGDLGMVSETHVSSADVQTMSFHDRQNQTFHQRWAKLQAQAKKDGIQWMMEEQKKAGTTVGDLDSLRSMLCRKYGTVACAWRHMTANDIDGKGRMAFGEFCDALRRIGYNGNMKNLWEELGGKKLGYVSLTQVDPTADEMLREFRTLLVKKYGSIMKAWQEGLDHNKNGSLEIHELKAALPVIGFKGDPEQLFKLLIAERGRHIITFADLDPLATQAYYRGDMRAMLMPPPPDDEEEGEGKSQSPNARRGSTSLSSWSKQLGRMTRDAMAANERERKEKLAGCSSLDAFKAVLKLKYGNLVCAWRNALDTDQSGAISFGELCHALRKEAFNGSIKEVWKTMDDDDSGLISLSELDAVANAAIEHFRAFLVEKFGGIVKVWPHFDPEKRIRVEEEQFLEGCKKIGYDPGSEKKLKRLFKYMPVEKGRRYICVEDLEVFLIGVPKSKKQLTWTGVQETKDEQAKRELQASQKARAKQKDKLMGASNLPDFKKMLQTQYGTLVAAWRSVLDTDGNGKLTYVEVMMALRNISFHGNVKELWADLEAAEAEALGKKSKTQAAQPANASAAEAGAEGGAATGQAAPDSPKAAPDSPKAAPDSPKAAPDSPKASGKQKHGNTNKELHGDVISLLALDAEAFKQIKEFREFLVEKFKGLEPAWKKHFDEKERKLIEEADFVHKCIQLDYCQDTPKKLKKLYKNMLPGRARKTISVEDFVATLLIGVEAVNRVVVQYGRSVAEINHNLGLEFREEQAKKKDAENALVKGMSSLEDFKHVIVAKYGTSVAAWRNALDNDGNGRLSFNEFTQAVRGLNFNGNLKELFKKLDADKSGLIQLNDLDPEAAEALKQFREFLLEKYGGLFDSWHQGFDTKKQKRLEEHQFVDRCAAIGYYVGYPKKAARLFKLLCYDKNSKSISVEDFNCMLIGVATSAKNAMWNGTGQKPPK